MLLREKGDAMPLKIVRNDITKMNTEAIVNTANEYVTAVSGCDIAIYNAAGYEELLNYRKEQIGIREEGSVFITPGYNLNARFIIHAVSPFYSSGGRNVEEKLRGCYQKSLKMAKEYKISSIAFPLISTGAFGWPIEDGMRIAVDEIKTFLKNNEMDIYIVVFDEESTAAGKKIYPKLAEFINTYYVALCRKNEYEDCDYEAINDESLNNSEVFDELIRNLEKNLEEKTMQKSDSFSEYLMRKIDEKGLDYAEVYKRAVVDRKLFSKIKNNPEYHPQKITALCLCVGAMLSLEETKVVLARAGYAFSPSDLTDIIFAFYIENGHYNVIDIDIQLENYGLPCVID